MARPADPNSRQSLVAAARAEFARRGLRGARIEDITAACKLSKGAFYLHFPSKESLFGELVEAFNGEMSSCSGRRARMARAFRVRYGAVNRRDVETRSARWRRMIELETEEDLRVLEAMWTYRDVMGVLTTGAQGTPFEGAVWGLVDREMARVVANMDDLRCHNAIRSDIPSEIFATLVIGTYLLVGQRMSRLSEKPDLRAWATSLQALIREGTAPAAAPRARGLRPAAPLPSTSRGRARVASPLSTRSLP
ncbi:MAG: hypothetical protein NVSMB23_20530 [Myxococcales bacterium]